MSGIKRMTRMSKKLKAFILTVSVHIIILLSNVFITSESGVSRASYKSRVKEEMEKWQEKAQSEWDASTVNSETRKLSTEEKMARKIAKEVLRDNKKLGAVHSDASIQKLLEREAKKHLESEYTGPKINTHGTRGAVDPANPSTLPYLHKHPAV